MTETTLSGGEARRAARNAGAVAIARIISSGAQFGWQLILVRALTEAAFGVYGTVGPLYAIGAAITAFSMSMIVIRDLARRPQAAGRTLAVTLVLQTVLALVAYLGINAAALGYDDTIRVFVAIAGLSLFIDMLGNLCYDQLLAQERMVATSAVEVVQILLRIGLAALALLAGFGLLGVYAATIFSGIVRSAALWWLLRRTGVRPAFPLDRSIAVPLLVNSAPLAVASFINITYVKIDQLLTTSVLTVNDTAHLTAALVIIYGVVDILSTTVLIAIYPLMARVYRGDGRDELYRFIVEKLAFFTLLVGLPIGLVFSLFAPDIIVPLFGAGYAAAASILRLLIWYAVVTMIINVFAQAYMTENRQRRWVVLRVGGLALKLALSLFLLPRIGVIGAATATVAAETALLLVAAGGFRFNLRLLLPRLLRLALVAALTVLAMLLLGALNPLVGMIGGAAVYLLGVLFGRVLADDDFDLLYRLTAAIPGGALILRFWHRRVELNW